MNNDWFDQKLRDVFENKGFKIYQDEAGKRNKKDPKWWFYELRGKRGMVYPYSASQLAGWAYRKNGVCPTQFVKSKGYHVIQDADDALVFLFPVSDFHIVSSKFNLKLKRVVEKNEVPILP